MHAHYLLLRAIIEATVEVKWILESDDHRERVQRSMRARRTELKWDIDLHAEILESGRLYGDMPEEQIAEGEAAFERQAKKELDQIRAVSDRAGLDWGKRPPGCRRMSLGFARSVHQATSLENSPQAFGG